MIKTKLVFCILFSLSGATLFGQACFDDNLRGSYGALATLGTRTATGTTPGTTPTYSSSPIGSLLSAISKNDGSSAAATLYFDGAGRIWGSSSQTNFPQLITGNSVGTYTVSENCTVRISFTDAFSAAPTVPPATTSLIGLVVKGGSEVFLSQLDSSSTGTGAAGRAQRTAIRLVRFSNAYSAGCSVGTLRGGYALVGEGFSTVPLTPVTGTPATPAAPYYSTFFGRVNFDGQGKLLSDTAGGTSLGTFQYTGTYTVNNDCSGTLTITQSTETTPPTPVVNTSARFLITPAKGDEQKPGLIFSVANNEQTIYGTGAAQ